MYWTEEVLEKFYKENPEFDHRKELKELKEKMSSLICQEGYPVEEIKKVRELIESKTLHFDWNYKDSKLERKGTCKVEAYPSEGSGVTSIGKISFSLLMKEEQDETFPGVIWISLQEIKSLKFTKEGGKNEKATNIESSD